MSIGRKTAVVGVGYSSISRALGLQARSLAVDAVKAAVADSGIDIQDIDGIYEYPGSTGEAAVDFQRLLGIESLSDFGDFAATGASALSAVIHAEMAVASGHCEVALVIRAITREWGQMSGQTQFPPAEGAAQYLLPYGAAGAVLPVMGMRKRRREFEFGTREEDYGAIAVNARKWSAMNERAMLRDPITMDDYLSARYVAEPLRLLDCDYPGSGAVAVLITTEERAKDLRQKPVIIDATSHGTGSRPDWTFPDDLVFGGTRDSARRLWERSSVTVDDVDVAEIYDGFTHIAMSWIEALGFCDIGEFGDWVDGGKTIGPGGSLPMNTSGGQLAEGRLHGLGFLAEATQQLRGQLGERQVEGADVAVVTNAFGPQCASLVLLTD